MCMETESKYLISLQLFVMLTIWSGYILLCSVIRIDFYWWAKMTQLVDQKRKPKFVDFFYYLINIHITKITNFRIVSTNSVTQLYVTMVAFIIMIPIDCAYTPVLKKMKNDPFVFSCNIVEQLKCFEHSRKALHKCKYGLHCRFIKQRF